jgi:hypothetical protein
MDKPALTPEGNDALKRARAIAVGEGFDRADLAHILVALLDCQTVRQLMGMFGAEPDKLRESMRLITSDADWQVDRDAESRTVEFARLEASQMGLPETGPEHLLLAIVRQSGSMPAFILRHADRMSISPTALRGAVTHLHGQNPTWSPPSRPGQGVVFPGSAMGEMTPEQKAKLMKAAIARQEVHLSPLRRVVAIDRGRRSAGVLVELIALEVREAGSMLYWRTETETEGWLSPGDPVVRDDLGTTYRVRMASAGGGPRETRATTWVEPRLPESASSLTIEFHPGWATAGLPQLEAPVESIDGEWSFEVEL